MDFNHTSRKDKKRQQLSNPVFVILCALVIITPMLRGSVHPWAETLIQVMALSGCVIVMLERVLKGASQKAPGAFPVIFPVALLALVAAFFSGSRVLAFEGTIRLATYLMVFFLSLRCVRTRKEQRILVYVTIGTAAFLSFTGLLKLSGIGVFGLWDYPDVVRNNYSSLTGPFVNRNHMAGFLGMTIPLLLGLFVTRERSWEKQLFMIFLALFLVVSQVMTLSRGGWAATAGSLLFILAVLVRLKEFSNKRIVLWIAASVFTGAIFVFSSFPVVERVTSLTQRDASVNLAGRARIWKGTMGLIRDNMYTGTGPGTFASVFPAYQEPGDLVLPLFAHNDYLHFIAETGFFCVPVMLWLIFLFFRAGVKKLKSRSRQTRGMALGAMGSMVAILIHSLSDFNLHIPSNIVLLAVIAGMAIKDSGRYREPGEMTRQGKADT